jgi:hypothetical protein
VIIIRFLFFNLRKFPMIFQPIWTYDQCYPFEHKLVSWPPSLIAGQTTRGFCTVNRMADWSTIWVSHLDSTDLTLTGHLFTTIHNATMHICAKFRILMCFKIIKSRKQLKNNLIVSHTIVHKCVVCLSWKWHCQCVCDEATFSQCARHIFQNI